jgi:hypothetical protein
MIANDRIPNTPLGDLKDKPSNRIIINNAGEIEKLLSRTVKLRLRIALEIVARVMGDTEEISAIQLKELLEPLTETSNNFPEILSVLGLRFSSATTAFDSRFRLGPRPTVEIVENNTVYEVILQDAMTWNWTLDNEGPWIFWMLRLKTKEAKTFGNGKSQVIFVKQPKGSRLINKDFSPPTLKTLGKNSQESILRTDRIIPIKTQATVLMRSCYLELLKLIKNDNIDLEKTRTVDSFLVPVRTSKIGSLEASNSDVIFLKIIYYSLAIFLDQIRRILKDPKFKDCKASEHLVHLKELGLNCHNRKLSIWCNKFLHHQEKFLKCDSSIWPSSYEIISLEFLNLNEIMEALNQLRIRKKATSPARHILATADIIEIIRKNNPDISFGQVVRKYASMIEIWHVLKTCEPKTLKELGEKTNLTERTCWKHISKLREWGALPPDIYTRLSRQ